jgi:deoxyhypusine synthase
LENIFEIIRQDKVHIISCTGANLEEDIMNLVAHSHYERVPNYRDLTSRRMGFTRKRFESCY